MKQYLDRLNFSKKRKKIEVNAKASTLKLSHFS